MVSVKGHEIHAITVKDSFQRRALQFKNKIIDALKHLDIGAS